MFAQKYVEFPGILGVAHLPDIRSALTDIKTAIDNQAKALTGTINLLADDPSIPEGRKAELIIHLTSAICERTTALQPIPFADLFILSPIQVVMVLSLSRVMGNTVTRQEALDLIGSVLKNMGAGVLATQGMLGLYKTAMPLLGRAVSMPMIYASTAGIGYASKAILEGRREGRKLSSEEVLKAKRQGEERAKARRSSWTTEALTDEIDTWRNRMAQYDEYRTKMSAAQARLEEARTEIEALEVEEQNLDRLMYSQGEVKSEFEAEVEQMNAALEQQNSELFQAEERRNNLLEQLAGVERDIAGIQERRKQSEQSIADMLARMERTTNLTPAEILESKAGVDRKVLEAQARRDRVMDERVVILAERFSECYAWLSPTEPALRALASMEVKALHDAEKATSGFQPAAPGAANATKPALDLKDGSLCIVNEKGEAAVIAQSAGTCT